MSGSPSAHVLNGNSPREYLCPQLPVMGRIRDWTEATAIVRRHLQWRR